jgi:RNA polymerase sigma-70 factor, ECF subfamily
MAISNDEFVKWFMPLQGDLLAYVLAMGVAPEDADDVLQDAACVVLRKMPEFQGGTNFRGWAYAIIRNETLNYLKTRKRRRTLTLSAGAMSDLASMASESPQEPSIPLTMLNMCMQNLQDKTRELLRRRYEQGRSVLQIAEELGRPVESVYVTLSRIRKALQKCIERQGVLEEKSL